MSDLLTAKELKEQASIVDLLSRLGYQPVPKRGREKMYISMLRDNDTDPSFSVNDELGVWFDHGTGKGGNIVDFGLAYWKNLRFNEVIKKLQETCSIEPGIVKVSRPRLSVKVPHYIVEQVKPLGSHPAITGYLKSRGVFDAARQHMKEVYYYVEDEKGMRKHFFAAGWLNENKAWEVRNKYFKGCMGPQGISFIRGHEKKAVLFEGFINFLSWRIENPEADHSVIVLNSTSALKAGISKAKEFSSLDVFFDRDQGGYTATKDFLKALPYATDRSAAYSGFNDYNDKIKSQMNISKEGKAADFFSGVRIPFRR